MAYCPNGHGEKNGGFCDECAAALTSQPPGEGLRIRSPQASAAVSQSIYLPGSHAPGAAPVLVHCPRCGRRNREEEVFDCQGVCGRENLCLRHFDAEYDVCVDCARALRRSDEQAAAAQTALRLDLAEWQSRAEAAERELVALTQRYQQSESARQQVQTAADAERSAGQARERSLNEQTAHWKERAERAEGELPGLRRQAETAQSAQAQADTEKSAAHNEAAGLKQSLAEWKGRAEKAEGALAAIRRKEEEAAAKRRQAEEEARRKAEAEETRQKAEAVRTQNPLWQQIGIELVKIPAGNFLYGDSKTSIHLDEFSISKTPVTNAQYEAFVDAAGQKPPRHWEKNGRIPNGKEKHPVVYVSWDDAVAFCEWAGLRLPTEQEWEKGARGTDGRTYPWGEEAPDAKRCNFDKKVGNTTPVGNYPAGANGLLDMAGNVWEWCADWYDSSQKYRVLRGGSWGGDAANVRPAYRGGYDPANRNFSVGFRLVAPGL